MQIALGLVAAEMGVCLVPYAASRHRADLQYRMIDDEHATSPVLLSNRRNDDSPYLALIKALLQAMYAGAQVWLDSGKASDDGTRPACIKGEGPSSEVCRLGKTVGSTCSIRGLP